jgi:endoglucanase
MPFTLQRGTNVGCWLSQSNLRGCERDERFTRADIQRIAGWGFDHIRLPVDEVQLWDDAGVPEPDAWRLLDSTLDWCAEAGLRAVVDLHVLRTHRFVHAEEQALFADPREAERFTGLWERLSDHLGHRSTDLVAYELLNEPVAEHNEEWNRVAQVAFNRLRAREPERTLVLGSNFYCIAKNFKDLWIPDDDRVILTFHFYGPMFITHYRASWWEGGVYQGPVHYPGRPIADDDLPQVPAAIRHHLPDWNEPYGPEQMARDMHNALVVGRQTGKPLWCSEFGICDPEPPLPRDLRLRWFRDLLGLFTANDVAYANWTYWNLRDAEGNPSDILETLTHPGGEG